MNNHNEIIRYDKISLNQFINTFLCVIWLVVAVLVDLYSVHMLERMSEQPNYFLNISTFLRMYSSNYCNSARHLVLDEFEFEKKSI